MDMSDTPHPGPHRGPPGGSSGLIEIVSAGGLIASLHPLGARLHALRVPGTDGRLRDIVCGHDTPAEHIGGDRFGGVICGRYAGRIGGARFTLDGVTHRLSANQGANILHGGANGFDIRNWSTEPIAGGPDGGGVQFVLISADGEEGFPGRLVATATYRFAASDTLECALTAVSSRPTVVNLTNHVYWNLAGAMAGGIGTHMLEVDAAAVLETGDGLIPTGRLLPVAGAAIDFCAARPIADALAVLPGGLDHTFVIDGARGTLRRAARLTDPASGLSMELSTTEPGVQVYTAGHHGPQLTGKAGTPFQRFGAVALEPQNFPDAPNQPAFPSAVLRPGEIYRHVMRWRVWA